MATGSQPHTGLYPAGHARGGEGAGWPPSGPAPTTAGPFTYWAGSEEPRLPLCPPTAAGVIP